MRFLCLVFQESYTTYKKLVSILFTKINDDRKIIMNKPSNFSVKKVHKRFFKSQKLCHLHVKSQFFSTTSVPATTAVYSFALLWYVNQHLYHIFSKPHVNSLPVVQTPNTSVAYERNALSVSNSAFYPPDQHHLVFWGFPIPLDLFCAWEKK